MNDPRKPFIARDTGEPLVVLGGYEIAEGGGILRRQTSREPGKDYGADPIFDDDGEPTGMVKLVPSGRVVPAADRVR